jgi:hypothetical protein
MTIPKSSMKTCMDYLWTIKFKMFTFWNNWKVMYKIWCLHYMESIHVCLIPIIHHNPSPHPRILLLDKTHWTTNVKAWETYQGLFLRHMKKKHHNLNKKTKNTYQPCANIEQFWSWTRNIILMNVCVNKTKMYINSKWGGRSLQPTL